MSLCLSKKRSNKSEISWLCIWAWYTSLSPLQGYGHGTLPVQWDLLGDLCLEVDVELLQQALADVIHEAVDAREAVVRLW